MKKKLKEVIKHIITGFIIILFLATLGFVLFLGSFEIFEEPQHADLQQKCDNKDLRNIKMIEVLGNATVNNSIQIYASNCAFGDNNNGKPELIFIASAPFINPKDVYFEWKNFDTLTITYNKDLDVFEKKIVSEVVKPKITFEYIIE